MSSQEKKNFEILSGNPTPEEIAALAQAIEHHKREELEPVIRRSVFSIPQLRRPMPHQNSFGFTRGR